MFFGGGMRDSHDLLLICNGLTGMSVQKAEQGTLNPDIAIVALLSLQSHVLNRKQGQHYLFFCSGCL